MSKDIVGALPDLGKRVERLLYFGSLLLLLCCLELYLVSAALYSLDENPADIGALIDRITVALPKLQASHQKIPNVRPTDLKTAKDRRVAETRRQLGLPPQVEVIEEKEETYAEMLKKLGTTTYPEKPLHAETLKIVANATQPPEKILAELRARQQALIQRPVTIWGIETPLVMPLQYGGAQYQVPTSFLANSLLLALSPLLIGWLGSLYVTRQRELSIMRGIIDYRQSFPHVLNIVSVDFSAYLPFMRRKKRRKNEGADLLINRVAAGLLRSSVLLVFAVPMSGILAYCAVQLVVSIRDREYWQLAVLFIFITWIFVQTVLLVAQEWLLLWNKQYYPQ